MIINNLISNKIDMKLFIDDEQIFLGYKNVIIYVKKNTRKNLDQ